MTEVITLPTGVGPMVVSGGHGDSNHNGYNGYNSGHGGDMDRQFFFHSLNQRIVESSIATEKTGASINVNVEKTAAAALLAVEKTAAANQLTIEKTAAANLLSNAVSTAALQVSIERVSNEGKLLQIQNAAAAAAALAACCCELKELIREDGDKTRQLVSSIQLHNTQVELADLKMQIAVSKSLK